LGGRLFARKDGAKTSGRHRRLDPQECDYDQRMAGPLFCGGPQEVVRRILTSMNATAISSSSFRQISAGCHGLKFKRPSS
jgi:hypothetical protein